MFNKLKTLHPRKIFPAILIVVLGGSAVAAGAATGGNAPRQSGGIQGVVASVDGNTTAGTCMTSGTGTFTLTVAEGRATTTVDVTATTTYTDSAVTSPTFANVCVGNDVGALGTFSSGTLTATSVEIVLPPQANVQGIVASVGGSSTADLCVTSNTESFTVVGGRSLSITTVNLSSTTTYSDAAVTTPSYTDICVAGYVKALGALASGTLTATSVAILPRPPVQAQGIVASVGGSSTAGTCLSSGTGTFTLVGGNPLAITNVAVTSTTTYKDHAVTTPSYGDVCVGSHLDATGALSSGTLTASSISIQPPFVAPGPGGHGGHNPRPGRRH
ncbi:MAG: hypothetical protein ABSF89_18715 [Acidimicrobiales bacterium]|jgi:hypothetical protein